MEAAKRAKLFLDAGLPEDGVLDTSRLIGISMANLADANVDLVGEVFTEPGVDERELALRYAAAAKTMAPLLGETLLHAYRIHLREAYPPGRHHRGRARGGTGVRLRRGDDCVRRPGRLHAPR